MHYWDASIMMVHFRLEPGENIEENKKNLLMITQKVFSAIVGSAYK